ncbi:MAG: hypothetical protein PUE04_02175 [Lachnospira sp.]|nr:hypothetical protein [Lachnospira sp.]
MQEKTRHGATISVNRHIRELHIFDDEEWFRHEIQHDGMFPIWEGHHSDDSLPDVFIAGR